MKEYIRIKNWTKHQHYKGRRPPWIKLHSSLFDDYDFSNLSDKSKWQLVAIWLLASKTNKFHKDGDPLLPLDVKYLTRQSGMEEEIDLNPLFESGFITRLQCESDLQAFGVSETETETETDTELHDDSTDNFNPKKMSELWNEAVTFFSKDGQETNIPKVRGLPKDRYKKCLERIKDCELDDKKWRTVLNAIHSDDWLSGRKPSSKYPNWKANFDYVIRKPTTILGLIEGFENKQN